VERSISLYLDFIMNVTFTLLGSTKKKKGKQMKLFRLNILSGI